MFLKPRGGLSTLANYPATVGLDGYSALVGTWTAAPADVLQSRGNWWSGVMVEVPVTLATGRTDLALSPPTFTGLDFTLTVVTGDVTVIDYTYTLYLVNDPTPADFATGATSPSLIVGGAGNPVLLDTQTITGPIVVGQEVTSSLDMGDVFPVYRQASWVGRFAFIFRFGMDGFAMNTTDFGSAAHATTPPTLVSVELPFIGGRSGNVEARSRVDRCPICGFYDVREKFTPDGYRAGLLVCEKCWDPEDPPSSPIPPDVSPIND